MTTTANVDMLRPFATPSVELMLKQMLKPFARALSQLVIQSNSQSASQLVSQSQPVYQSDKFKFKVIQ